MLNSKKLTRCLWAKALNTACYIINYVYLQPDTKKTSYELWKGKKSNLSYFHIFNSTCYILKDHQYLGKFDSKSDEGVFLGYSMNSKTYQWGLNVLWNLPMILLMTLKILQNFLLKRKSPSLLKIKKSQSQVMVEPSLKKGPINQTPKIKSQLIDLTNDNSSQSSQVKNEEENVKSQINSWSSEKMTILKSCKESPIKSYYWKSKKFHDN